MLRWRVNERSTVFVSYAHSRARGELNDYNQFFGNFSYPLIRANQYGPVASEAPPSRSVLGCHRFARIDQNWNFLGPKTKQGVCLPPSPSIANCSTRSILHFRSSHPVPRRPHRYNVLNHFNPRDVQQYDTSPNYSTFCNSIGRLLRIDGDFNF